MNTPVQALEADRIESQHPCADWSYLGIGLYSLPEAARLLRMPLATLRRWTGDAHSPAGDSVPMPLIEREAPELAAQGLLTFSELIVLLLIRQLRQAGVPLGVVRALAEPAAVTPRVPHPFATRRFFTDQTSVSAWNTGPERAFSASAVSEKWRRAIQEVLASLAEQLEYVEDERIRSYWPLGKGRRVVLDPARALGQPIDPMSGVPTRALAGMSAAGEPIEEIASWYRVDLAAVQDAILFERSLTAVRLPRAA
jgi:uncharacterized protein (DUF433 family)